MNVRRMVSGVKKHYCGEGFKGRIIRTHRIIFCELCGHQFR